MNKSRPKAYINWSSGKDAMMALCIVLAENKLAVELLFTTVNKKFNRVSMHGLHRSLLEAQAKVIGIPLEILEVDEYPNMEEYNQLMSSKVNMFVQQGYSHSVFGDIFLEDLRDYREKLLRPSGIKYVFPLWKKDTTKLLLEFISSGFKAIIVCCNAKLLSKSFCGRVIDEQFLHDLPEGLDPCGENGEFHTFCYDGPCFKKPVSFIKGEIIYRTYPAPKTEKKNKGEEYGFWFCDLKLESKE